eukprot:scaffold42973_cov39-Tisochrysis_lutea.AAC.1
MESGERAKMKAREGRREEKGVEDRSEKQHERETNPQRKGRRRGSTPRGNSYSPMKSEGRREERRGVGGEEERFCVFTAQYENQQRRGTERRLEGCERERAPSLSLALRMPLTVCPPQIRPHCAWHLPSIG